MTETLRYDRLRDFIGQLATVLDENHDESAIFQRVKPMLAELVRHMTGWMKLLPGQITSTISNIYCISIRASAFRG